MLKDWQRELIGEAIEVYNCQETFNRKLLEKFGHSVTQGRDVLVSQIEIIVGADKEQA